MTDVRLLVCGGTRYNGVVQLHQTLLAFHQAWPITALIEGEAPGADTLARDWAQMMRIPVEPYPCTPADWDLFGNRAGLIRNARMLRESRPTHGIAFPGARGTADMVARLTNAGVPTLVGRWSNGPNSKINWTKNG